MMNDTFNILVVCEESQAISSEIRRLNRDLNIEEEWGIKINAWSCDLLATSAPKCESNLTGPKWHLKGDALAAIYGGDSSNEFLKAEGIDDSSHIEKAIEIANKSNWDMIIANPPCTYLTVSGVRWYHDSETERKREGREKALSFHPRFPKRKIERAESIRFLISIALAPCKYIILENPTGTLKRNLMDGAYNHGNLPDDYEEYLDFNLNNIQNQIKCANKKSLKYEKLMAAKKDIDIAKEELKDYPVYKKDPKEKMSIIAKEDRRKANQKTIFDVIMNKHKEFKLPPWEELSKLQLGENSNCSWLINPPDKAERGNHLNNDRQPTLFGKIQPYPVAIQPYYFGDPHSKKTCLWMKGFTHEISPVLKEKDFDKGEFVVFKKSGKKQPKWYSEALKVATAEERRTLRSKTFPGIAKAIAVQWVLWAISEEKGTTKNRLREKYLKIEESYFKDEGKVNYMGSNSQP